MTRSSTGSLPTLLALSLSALASCSSPEQAEPAPGSDSYESPRLSKLEVAPSAFDLIERTLSVSERHTGAVQLTSLEALETVAADSMLAETRLVLGATFRDWDGTSAQESYSHFLTELSELGGPTEVHPSEQRLSVEGDEMQVRGIVLVARGRAIERRALDEEQLQDLSKMVRMVSAVRGSELGSLDIRWEGESPSRLEVRPARRKSHELEGVRSFLAELESEQWGMRVTSLWMRSGRDGGEWNWQAEVRG